MSDCLFCKIISGEIPSYKVYEDDYVLAFLDIHPIAKGHTVVVPKKHADNLLDMTNEQWRFMGEGIANALRKVDKALRPEGANIGVNNGEAAGQVVGHAHWHIIPRWKGDGGGNIHSIIRAGEGVDVGEIAKLF